MSACHTVVCIINYNNHHFFASYRCVYKVLGTNCQSATVAHICNTDCIRICSCEAVDYRCCSAMVGIAIGLAVMIVSVAVVIGFKHEVRDKVIGLGSDIMITKFDARKSFETIPIVVNDSLLNVLYATKGVKHVQRYSTKPGMIMTDDSFQGMVLKGVAGDYDWDFLKQHLLEGEIPVFSDTASTNKVLVSRSIADKLHLKMDDKLYT